MKPLKLEALAEYTYLSSLNATEEGRWMGYVTHKANMEDNGYTSDLWAIDTFSNEKTPRQMTASGKAGQFIWLKNSAQMLYSSSKEESVKKAQESGEPLTVFYTIDTAGGESLEYMRVPLKVTGIQSIDDDRFLLLALYHPEYDRYNAAPEFERPSILKAWKEENDYEVIEEIPFWNNGGTFTRGSRNRLYLYTRSTKELKALTGVDDQVQYFHFEETVEKYLVILRNYRGKMPLKSNIAIGNLSEGTAEPITQETHAIHFAYFLDKHTVVFLGNDGSTHGLNQNAIFYKLDLNTKEYTEFSNGFDKTVGNTVGSDARYGVKRQMKAIKGQLYFVTTEGENAQLNHMDECGNVKPLTHLQGAVDDFDCAGDLVIINALVDNKLPELYRLKDLSTQPLTHYNDWVYDTYMLSVPEHLQVATDADTVVDGWVLKPVDYDSNKLYPSILNIHGGPKTVYGTVFYHEMQYWANKGYFVYFCNPRGSDGKGNAFADIRGKYGTIDYSDIMSFADAVLEKYPAMDTTRMYVTGGSYGGFMTNWIVGHTHRFKAAAAQRSISNWTTEYGVTDIGYYFVPDQTAADPWSNYEKLWDQSPLKYANQVKTPLLLIHSDMDYRCWIPEAFQMFTALKDFGVETRLCMFKGENHELSRSGKPKHRIRRLFEITEWFDKH